MSCAMHSPCISQSLQNNILEKIAAKTRQRIAKERQEISDSELEQQAYEIAQKELAQEGAFTFPFEKALAKSGVSFICEVKKASPSKGIIAQEFDYLEIARSYKKAGADAISCLTEPYYFLGSNEYLKEIAKTVSIPLLRKDFTVDTRMIYEAKVLDASAVLLICALLNDEELECFITLSHNLGLSALVEAHDASEIKRALIAGARIIGVNNRNLVNFEVDTKNSMRLRKYAGNNVLFVSESGIKTRSDVSQLETLGVDALLVGEALMKSARKDEKLAELRGRESLPKRNRTPKRNLSPKLASAINLRMPPTKLVRILPNLMLVKHFVHLLAPMILSFQIDLILRQLCNAGKSFVPFSKMPPCKPKWPPLRRTAINQKASIAFPT